MGGLLVALEDATVAEHVRAARRGGPDAAGYPGVDDVRAPAADPAALDGVPARPAGHRGTVPLDFPPSQQIHFAWSCGPVARASPASMRRPAGIGWTWSDRTPLYPLSK